MGANQNPFSAAGALLGYLYQCRHALLLFIGRWKHNPETDVTIERFDDISFEMNGTPAEQIQTKHHVRAKGKLTDTSHDLWATLRVWFSMATTRAFRMPGTTFFLMTTSKADAGSAASLLRSGSCRDTSQALAALTQVAEASTEKSNQKEYKTFLETPADIRQAIIEAVFVTDQAPGIQDVRRDIEAEVRPFLRPGDVPLYVDRLEAWWFRRVISHLRGDAHHPILGTELNAQMADLRDQFRAESLPIDMADSDPPQVTVTELLRRTFVEQLRLVALSDRRVKRAIMDYYRAFEQRSRWVREELLHVAELRQYDKRLTDEWELRFDRIQEDLSPSASEQEKIIAGKGIYRWAEDAEIRIRPACTEPFVSRGSFQMLADEIRIGWHPEYEQRLKTLLTPVEA